MSDQFDTFLTHSGISLSSLGIRGVGFLRSDALRAIKILRDARLAILGGDVYYRRNEKIVSALNNWYAEPKPSEDVESFLHRSWDLAEAYITGFQEPPDAEVIFAIVVGKAL